MLLALAVGGVPLVADWCAISCEAAHGATEAAPACHHTSAPMAHVGDAPAPCGHDHHPVVVDASTISDVTLRAAVAARAPGQIAVHHTPTAVALSRSRIDDAPSSTPLDLALAFALRI